VLYLKRHEGEAIQVGEATIRVMGRHGRQVVLGVDAPASMPVRRVDNLPKEANGNATTPAPPAV